MSQSSSQALDPSWMSVSFAKFSHNSSPFGTRNFTWNHVGSRNDLDFILRNTRLMDENGHFHNRLFMKINAGAEELEQQDLYELVQLVNSFDPSSGNDSPVQIVVKSPFLAMRYPKSVNIVRRIQLKFHNDADFNTVLNFIKDLELPITVPVTIPHSAPISRPTISPSPSLLSSTSASSSVTAPSMLSIPSVSTSSSRISLPTPSSNFHSATRATVELLNIVPQASTSEFKVPLRPTSSVSEPQKPANSSSYAIPQIARPATTSTFFPFTGPSPSHIFTKPPTSVYITQMERESQRRRPSLPALPALKSSQEGSQLNLSLFESTMDSQNQSASQRPQNSDIQLSQSPFFAPRSVATETIESMARELEPSSHGHRRQEPDTLCFQKRNAALFESSEHLTIPPKRELPFPKPREIRPRSVSISEFSPLPKPTPTCRPKSASLTTKDHAIDQTKDTDPTPIIKATKKRVAQRKSTIVKPPEIAESPTPGQPNKVDAATSHASPQDEPSPLAAKSIAAASRPTSAASALQSKAAAPKKRAPPARPSSAAKRPRMIDQCTQTEMISDRDLANALHTIRKESACAPIVAQTTPTSVPAPAILPPESYLDAIDAFVTKHKARPAPKELWERAGWAEADEEERQMLLNDFICENLENKDFLQLCEDTAVAWRRIGLVSERTM